MTAKELLKLIENVDPADSDKLDEIDARVWCWVNSAIFIDTGRYEHGFCTFRYVYEVEPSAAPYYQKYIKYTRSRDALKAIRPEGWKLSFVAARSHTNSFGCVLYRSRKEANTNYQDNTKEVFLPTEELAELHAIIQAIEWERGK